MNVFAQSRNNITANLSITEHNIDAHSCLLIDVNQILATSKNAKEFTPLKQAGEKKYSALHQAALKGNVEIYNYLISQGADNSIKDADGNSPDHYLNQRPNLKKYGR